MQSAHFNDQSKGEIKIEVVAPSLSVACFEGYRLTQYGCYMIGSEYSTQKKQPYFRSKSQNVKMRKKPMPRIIISHVVSLAISICE